MEMNRNSGPRFVLRNLGDVEFCARCNFLEVPNENVENLKIRFIHR